MSSETPPRAWGRRSACEGWGAYSGNTPTCVGKTLPAASRHTSTRKHPHVRGEDALQTSEETNQGETPPRAWGRPPEPLRQRAGCRNTPTCVGKTAAAGRMTRSSRKHPHVRGEDKALIRRLRACLETPPRAWGRHIKRFCFCLLDGNTPTCVGKTFYHGLYDERIQKHPHVRGEDSPKINTTQRSVETPPRAWGRLDDEDKSIGERRNTPTCVGKTLATGCRKDKK